MRTLIAVVALAALVASAEAQQARPQGQPKPPAQAQPREAPPPPAPLAIFACRTAEEICFLGIVTGNNEVAVLFTNAPQAEDIDAKPVTVTTGAGTPMDLAPHLGRVVMLTGAYEPQAGLTKAELVEVASPLVSLILKAQLAEEEEPAPEPPPPSGKPQPSSKPQPKR